MSIRVRLQSGNLDGIRPLPRVDGPPPPPPRAAAPTAPLKPESANTGSRLSLGTVTQSSQEKAEKLKGVAEDLKRQAEAGGDDAGAVAQEAEAGLMATAQQGLEQGAMSRRMARFGAEVVRAVPVVDQGLEAVSGAVDRMAQAPGVVGRVGKVIQGAENLGDVIEKADFGVLAAGAAADLRDQVSGVSRALKDGNYSEALSQSAELGRSGVDVKEGAALAREVAAAAPEAIRKAAAPVARAAAPVARDAAPVARAAAPVARAAGTVARTGTRVVRATGSAVRAAATRVAGSAAGRVAGSALGKAAGRFVPGVNVLIAASAVNDFVGTMRNPKASAWKKGKDFVTAAGSVIAASGVPGLSQGGAAVAILSSLAPDKRPRWLGGK